MDLRRSHAVRERAEWQLGVNDGEKGVEEGELIDLEVGGPPVESAKLHWQFDTGNKGTIHSDNVAGKAVTASWDTSGMLAGTHTVSALLVDERGGAVTLGHDPVVADRHGARQGAAAQPGRHVARVTAASGRDPHP